MGTTKKTPPHGFSRRSNLTLMIGDEEVSWMPQKFGIPHSNVPFRQLFRHLGKDLESSSPQENFQGPCHLLKANAK
jgi:hypothetical protein